MKSTPTYKHDCTKCVYLGNISINGKLGDVYVCPDIGGDMKYDDVLVRFSNEGCDYLSTMPAYFHPLSPFSAAAISMWCQWKEFTGCSRNSKGGIDLFDKQGKFTVTI